MKRGKFNTNFRQESSQKVNWGDTNWDDLANAIRETARKVIGMTTGKKWGIKAGFHIIVSMFPYNGKVPTMHRR